MGTMMKSSRVAAIFLSAVLYNRLINRLVKRARRVGYGAGLASPIINFPVFKRAPSGLPIRFFHEPRPRMIYEESPARGLNPTR